MAENQPPTIVEGATTGDVDDEIPAVAKSAEDRKAQAALSSLDNREDDSANKDVDVEAVRKAMERLGGSTAANGSASGKEDEKKVVKKAVKVDPADVTLLVCHLWKFLTVKFALLDIVITRMAPALAGAAISFSPLSSSTISFLPKLVYIRSQLCRLTNSNYRKSRRQIC